MTLSRRDTSFLKGFAILLIALHNFCHWLPMAVVENEYTFQLDRIWKYVGYLEAGRPHVVLNFLSHFGHYGVPLFLFLSGYGLVKKYEQMGAPTPSTGRFLWNHLTKLWKLMVPAVALFILTEWCFRGGFHRDGYWVALLLGYVTNLVPGANLILGPWWFFSLIVQFYLLYRLVLHRFRSPWLLWGLVGASLLFQAWLYVGDIHFSFVHKDIYALDYVRYNALGHLLSFALGIAWARKPLNAPPLPMMLAGWVLTIASAFNVWLWFFSPLFAVMALLPLAHLVREGHVRRFLEWMGPISAAVFAFHPIVRHYLILPAGRAVRMGEPTLVYGEIVLYLLIVVLLAWGYTRLTVILFSHKNK